MKVEFVDIDKIKSSVMTSNTPRNKARNSPELGGNKQGLHCQMRNFIRYKRACVFDGSVGHFIYRKASPPVRRSRNAFWVYPFSFLCLFNSEAVMSERARTFLENQDFSRAIDELDELACRDSAGKELAVRLYRTYHPKMLEQSRAWANDVISWSRDHVLTSGDVAGEFLNLRSAMGQFENDYGVKVDGNRIPPATLKARQILDEEKQVCRYAVKEWFVLSMDVILMDSYKKKYDEKNKGEEWENFSRNEKVMRIRSGYRNNREQFEAWFNLLLRGPSERERI